MYTSTMWVTQYKLKIITNIHQVACPCLSGRIYGSYGPKLSSAIGKEDASFININHLIPKILF